TGNQKPREVIKLLTPTLFQTALRKILYEKGSIEKAVTFLLNLDPEAKEDALGSNEIAVHSSSWIRWSGIQSNEEKVVSFFQSSSEALLRRLPSCSEKRARLIISLRPFKNYDDLISKLEETKGVSEGLVKSYNELLASLSAVDLVIRRCIKTSEKMKNELKQLTCEFPTRFQQYKGRTGNVLKPYQVSGVNWMYLLYRSKAGGILADEMGLGKTVQALSFLSTVTREQGAPVLHLVVVPPSTADNWMREAHKWCTGICVLPLFGSLKERQETEKKVESSKESVLVINVGCLTLLHFRPSLLHFFFFYRYNACLSKHNYPFLKKKKFLCVIFDEGHLLKNMSTMRFRRLFKMESACRILLTGTPLQNNLLELVSLLYFVVPDLFGDESEKITSLFSGSAAYSSGKNTEEGLEEELDLVQRARTIMRPFVLRRRKEDVLNDLPEKTETVILCDMSASQEQLYYSLIEYARRDERGNVNNILMQLRKAANHPLLHRHNYSSDKLRHMAIALQKHNEYKESDAALVTEDMEVMTDFELHSLCSNWSALDAFKLDAHVLFDSGKFSYLEETLPVFKQQNDRVIIFSQFTMMLDILEYYLKEREMKFLRLDGNTAVEERQKLLDSFFEDLDIFVLLASTKAGGVGLNITAANVVILHDLDFNPHNDAQACSRVHRVGQDKPVKIIKLISKNTVESIIHERAATKLALESKMKQCYSNENELKEFVRLACVQTPSRARGARRFA
ncbi:LOW QUALITY PROTEIN: SWI/SNF-related matrix-associated actin-dependent regulator of chromatin subfamily A containing DEAD/H box 1-like, partial [Zophobas morio]|uniref:LOW QUALITY PROTEIN: SWI/SNF-related matrix-associated actin-dependent regulator of chromatin subfamily A containing DEAD/H box 1-like n=1 Tax=Zophobas morio TaxID=2755281 RepID=UPI0030828BDD